MISLILLYLASRVDASIDKLTCNVSCANKQIHLMKSTQWSPCQSETALVTCRHHS